MTREESIVILQESLRQNKMIQESPNVFFRNADIACGMKNAERRIAALNMAIAALRTKQDPPPNDPLTIRALEAVREERQRQDLLWGDQSGNSLYEWISILGEEYGELCETVNETCFKNPHHPERGGAEHIAKEAAQVAAVALQIIEAAYRRKPEEGTP